MLDHEIHLLAPKVNSFSPNINRPTFNAQLGAQLQLLGASHS